MGAYSALVSLEHFLEQILLDHDDDRDSSILGAKKAIISLHDNIVFLVGFLDDSPEDAGSLLEGRMTNAAYQVEDIIDYQISDEMHWDYRCWGVIYCIQQVILSLFPAHRISGGTRLRLRNLQKLHKELQNLMDEVENIVEEAIQIKNSGGTKERQISCDFLASPSSGPAPNRKGTAVVGLKEDLLELKGRLCGESSKLVIIPIIGMGGIGKTTLTRYAYDDPLMAYHFDIRAWVTVSQDYVIEKILVSILYFMNPSMKSLYDRMSKGELVEHLYKFLKGRRYLIVMDDVWDARVWDALRQALPDDFNGSRIMITSRELDLALYVDPSTHPHQLNLMNNDQSWNLLREKVFAQEHCPYELEKIGRFIAKKCGGLPLAIVVIAGILSKANQVQRTWKSIARNINKVVNSNDDKFNEILYLSYKHLPHYLRPCFLYMGGFPEDYEIRTSRLIKMWVAEGFLTSTRSQNLEEVAEEYLENLIKRSLVLVVNKKSDGNVKTVKIHDLLRDLCLKIAQNEKFLQVVDAYVLKPEIIRTPRRLSRFSVILRNFHGNDGSSIRTILCPLNEMVMKSWRSFELLKILDAYGVIISDFPVEIGKLFHLRYIALSIINLRKFKPLGALSKLQNLQTLIIMPYFATIGHADSSSLLKFRIWRLPQLRHLILFDICLPDTCTRALTSLENLHTLSRVASFTCSERILELVPNLNKLEIFYPLHDIFNPGWSRYKLNNLTHFHALEKLNLHVGRKPTGFRIPPKYCLRKSKIAFPTALKKLTLSGCELPWQDMTIIGSLPNLEVLKLRKDGCSGHKWETAEGEFCRLKVLVIDKSDPLQWITESSHFPCLQSLILYHCTKLEEIPESIGEIPTLQLIELDYCAPSIEESARCMEEEQRCLGNYDLRVRMLHRSS